MTNGEKLKEIFPDGVLTSINNSYYWGDDILVSKNWWNAEYKEPTTKNNLAVEKIVDILGSYTDLDIPYKSEIAENILTKLSSVTPQEPRCKECKWWKDSDSEYRRGCGAESRCPINRREVFEGNGYCYLFEPQKSEDKE